MNQPVCSIVIPTRDCLQYLPATLASIDLQGRSDLEVVLVDDGSSDGTAEWVRNRPYSGFALRVLETGGIGPSLARNAGVAAASGGLIAFLDADDLWWADKLNRQIAYHQAHPQTGLSFTDYIHLTPDGRTLGTCFAYWRCAWTNVADGAYFDVHDAEAKLLACNVVGTSTVVVNRAVFLQAGGFLSGLPSAEDWDLWLRLAALAPVACSASVSMSYLMRPGSETSNRVKRVSALAAIMARYDGRREPAIVSALSRARARVDVGVAEIARDAGNPAGAAAAHMRAMMADPGWRTGRALAADVWHAIRRPLRASGLPPQT